MNKKLLHQSKRKKTIKQNIHTSKQFNNQT
jgi:hypothetical protein